MIAFAIAYAAVIAVMPHKMIYAAISLTLRDAPPARQRRLSGATQPLRLYAAIMRLRHAYCYATAFRYAMSALLLHVMMPLRLMMPSHVDASLLIRHATLAPMIRRFFRAADADATPPYGRSCRADTPCRSSIRHSMIYTAVSPIYT